MSGDDPLLEVRDLEKHYPITEGVLKREVGRVRAVDGVSFEIRPGETLGLVGESGCGKSTAATSMLRLEEPTGGTVRFDGENVTEFGETELKRFRRRAQMIFQNPDSSFDPRMSVGESIAEPLLVQGVRGRERRRRIAADLLERVGLSESDVDRYPHEFSGGQKQRIGLARALVVNPQLIVADEPVSALDVSIQAEILSLMEDVQDEYGLAMLLISHDMGVVREVCDRVAVMYLGEIVETGGTEEVFTDPQHPYTRALLASIPNPDPRQRGSDVRLTGDVPSPSDPPSGCRFHTRCPEIIQPEGYELDQANWRAVMDLRVRLQQGQVDVEATREFLADDRGVDPGTVSEADVEAEIRSEHDVPPALEDADAEAVLSNAFDALFRGGREAAVKQLAEEFATPCEERHPGLVETSAGHRASCLRHEDDIGVEERRTPASADD